jgi:magnesium/cobalt transport protein CorA
MYRLATKPKYVSPEYTGTTPIQSSIECATYGPTNITVEPIPILPLPEEVKDKTWFILKGLSDSIPTTLKDYKIGNIALTAILNISERPLFLTCESGTGVAATYFNLELKPKRLTFWFDQNVVMSFQETCDDLFRPLLTRMEHKDSLTRKENSDRLFVALLDFLVDLYYPIVEIMDQKIQQLEETIFEATNPIDGIKTCRELKIKIHGIQSVLVPLQPIFEILFEEKILASGSTDYLKDVISHIQQLTSKFDQQLDNLDSLVDLCIALNSNKLNDLMRFLTVLSTFFLPLSFICAWYGTNFIVPETHWKYGYLYFIGLCVVSTLGCWAWFRQKRWL